jgi:hypothetical protein
MSLLVIKRGNPKFSLRKNSFQMGIHNGKESVGIGNDALVELETRTR